MKKILRYESNDKKSVHKHTLKGLQIYSHYSIETLLCDVPICPPKEQPDKLTLTKPIHKNRVANKYLVFIFSSFLSKIYVEYIYNYRSFLKIQWLKARVLFAFVKAMNIQNFLRWYRIVICIDYPSRTLYLGRF